MSQGHYVDRKRAGELNRMCVCWQSERQGSLYLCTLRIAAGEQ